MIRALGHGLESRSGTRSQPALLHSGESFEQISFVPYPGHESYAAKVTPAALQAALEKAETAYRSKDDAATMALSNQMDDIGFNRTQIPAGTYNMIDRDGNHYAPGGGLVVVKTTDDNQPRGPLRIAKSKDLASDVPADLKSSVTHIVGITMSYQGDVMVAAHGALFLLDRDLELKA